MVLLKRCRPREVLGKGGEAAASHGGTRDAASEQDLQIRPKNVEEFWCLRELRVYHKAAAAAKVARHEVLRGAWGEQLPSLRDSRSRPRCSCSTRFKARKLHPR